MKLSSKKAPLTPFDGPTDAQTATDAPPAAKPKCKARKDGQTPPKPTGASRKATTKEAEPAKAAKTLVKREKKETTAPREGGKTAMILELLRASGGARLATIMEKVGWQKHSMRGFISTETKKGIVIRSFKNEAGERCYSIDN